MMKSLIVFLWTYTIFAVEADKSARHCSINLSTDIKGFSPVFLTVSPSTGAYELFKPTGQISTFKNGSKLKVACTGNNNVFKAAKRPVLDVTCKNGEFYDKKRKKHFNRDQCKSVPKSTLKMTEKRCSNESGFIYEVGFTVESIFYGPVFEICYSNKTYTTFYTHNVLNGAAIEFSISESTRRPFSAKGMSLSTTTVKKFYKKEDQIERFDEFFGPDQTYITKYNFFARGHLSPDADFIFVYEQFATYFYVNVAPEYQNINAGNWLRVEELARKISIYYGQDIESYNGYIGGLELPGKDHKEVEVYLDSSNLIEVPKYLYKILLHKPTKSSIVYVTLNNPYIEDDQVEEICNNVCRKSGWIHENFSDATKGYTFCCRLNDFQKVVKTLPPEVKGRRLLKKRI